jgi:amino acid adenylation domain-containing protein
VLIQVEHHFVHDGWSYSVFLHELEALYLAFHAGKPSPLPDLPVQYADFACRQREWLQGGVAEAQLQYWREQLAGSPPVLELPTDRPRPAQQSFRGRSVRIQLPSQVAREVRAFCQREGVTLYVALLSAFHVLLHRYTGRTDLCLGSGIANRRWRETENLIGMIINTVALRTQFPGNATFRELMQGVRTTVLEAQAHADVPFDQVVDALQPERSLSYLPIYQHAFSFHNTPMPAFNLPDLAVSITEGNSYGSAKFDINVVVIPRAQQRAGATGSAAEEEIAMVWEYQTDLYDDATVERMIGHYQTLLAAAVADPGRPIGAVPLLTPAEREWLRTQWTGPAMAFPQDRCAHQLVEEQAAQRPDALAVAGQGMALTYRELDEQASRLAHALRSRGVGAGSVVATCMERSPQLIVSMLAAWKAGAAYMPIDPRHPAELVSFMLDDARPAALLTDLALAGVETASVGCIIRVDAEPAMPVLHPAVSADVGSPAYIIYTSGSTGRPKGVVVEHRSLLNLLCWTRQEFGLTPADRATQVAGQGFDASVWEIWSALTTGASLHIADEVLRSDPVALRDWVVAQQITFCFAPTPMAEALLALPWPAETALRTLQTGGDKLQVFPPPGLPFALHNNYGPTEATVITTACLVEPSGTGGGAPSIGRPIANMQICLLDAGMQPVPVGVPGELCVGGVGVARGYLNREELTRERFMPDSFSGEPGARLYRTGDLARCRPDGSIEFIGRLDQQVKIRGFRIELGEIEFALGAHPGVSQAVVTVYDGGNPGEQNRRLVGYVVPAPGARPSPAALRAFLKEQLPAHMVPSGFVLMEALPLTPNGKVDRRALPAPTEADRAAAFVAPRTAVEQVLAQVWSEVLGTAQVGIHDNFFELGGHSLMVAQTLSRIRSATGAELPIKELFDSPTIAELAPKVEQARLAQTDEEELARILAEINQLPQ